MQLWDHHEEKTKNELFLIKRNTTKMPMKRRKREMWIQVTKREMVVNR